MGLWGCVSRRNPACVHRFHLARPVKSTDNEHVMFTKKISWLCGNQLMELPRVGASWSPRLLDTIARIMKETTDVPEKDQRLTGIEKNRVEWKRSM
jgi:hypothetical protein